MSIPSQSPQASAPPLEPSAEDQHLRARGERIERLLDDLETMVGPVAWPRIEELVSALVELYGQGFERLIAHVDEVAGPDEKLRERLARDEVVSSLLLLHGLHPLPPEERARRALETLAERLGPTASHLSLVGVAENTVTLRVDADDETTRALAALATRAIDEAAPELAVRVEGLAPPAAAPPDLISVDRLRREPS